MNCPVCKSEIDLITDELKVAVNEDFWMNHCEKMLQQGGTPRKFENIPDYLKTERIKQYYKGLEIRIKKQGVQNETKSSVLEKSKQPS